MTSRHLTILIIVLFSCGTKKNGNAQETDLLKLFQIHQMIESGTEHTLTSYKEILGIPSSLTLDNFNTNKKFKDLKEKYLKQVERRIMESIDTGVNKDELIKCIKENKTKNKTCNDYIQVIMDNIIPTLQNFGSDLGTLIVNELQDNNELPKVTNSIDCKAVQQGAFNGLIGEDKLSVTRSSDIQTEIIGSTIRQFRLTWTNDCTYELTEKNLATNLTNHDGHEIITNSVIEIIKVTDEYYLYKLYKKGDNETRQLKDIGKLYR